MSEETKKAEKIAADAEAAQLSEQDLDEIAGGGASLIAGRCPKCNGNPCRCYNPPPPTL